MVEYHSDPARIRPGDLQGFFEGWPEAPSLETHHRLLAGSTHFIVAVPEGERRVIGYITAISDGVLCAYIPLLEVLPAHRGNGIGSTLMGSMLDRLEDLYMIDLVCDPALQPFYEAVGMRPYSAMIRRNYESIASRASR
ncbi:MAG: GNAT family N-acetyltransferase [Planctomycetota bacterium]|jgi:GNAT superfamily N-acetyltransferase